MKFFDDLPEIKCRPHAQAKRLKLTVSSSGIRLTYPPKTSTKTIEQFLEQSYSWLIETHRKQKNIELVVELPRFLNLSYCDNTVVIHYEMNLKKSKYDVQQQILFIPLENPAYHLTQFIIAQAKRELPHRLVSLAQHHQLTINKIRVATPKTRWGSCNSKQDIMLHGGLILMPIQYVDYVILHELAHTKYMHHQATFWQLLEELMPDAKMIQHQVKRWSLPTWWQPHIKD